MPQEDEYTYEKKLRRQILFYLYKGGRWVSYHCKIEELLHRIYIDSESPSRNDMKEQIKQLRNDQLISVYNQGKSVYLNRGKKNEIEAEIQDLIDKYKNF
jgi:hypothetical protein